MRSSIRLFLSVGLLALVPTIASSSTAPQEERSSIVITFKDGHQQTIPLTDVARIEFKTGPAASAAAATPPPETGSSSGRNAFVGKWKVGEGSRPLIDSSFFITLRRDGQAEKTIGSAHGTWTVVNGEARISWDDGWHDVIRKAGRTFEKAAFEPGHTFSDAPTNVTRAEKTEAEPI